MEVSPFFLTLQPAVPPHHQAATTTNCQALFCKESWWARAEAVGLCHNTTEEEDRADNTPSPPSLAALFVVGGGGGEG